MKGNIDVRAWKDFEVVVAETLRSFFPEGKLTINDRIRGKDSLVLREIDVAIRQDFGGQKILIVADCKHHSRRVDVKTMSEFCMLKKDVGATIGIIVSKLGFTKSALRIAHRELVTAYVFNQSKPETTPPDLWVPLIVEAWVLTPSILEVSFPDGRKQTFLSDENLDFKNAKTGKDLPPADMLEHLWEKYPDKKPGNFAWTVAGGNKSVGHSILIGAKTELLKLFRRAKLSFTGFVDQTHNSATALAYRITASDRPLAINDEKKYLNTFGGISMHVQTTVIQSANPRMAKIQNALLNGILEFQIGMKKPYSWSLPSVSSDQITPDNMRAPNGDPESTTE